MNNNNFNNHNLDDISKYGEIVDSSLFFSYNSTDDDMEDNNYVSVSKYNQVISQNEYSEMTMKKIILSYFGNIYLEKIKDQDDDSIYVARMPSKLMNEFRYIIVFVNKDNKNVGNITSLSLLNWKCLQTRQIPDRYNISLKTQEYTANDIPPFNTDIFLVDQNEKRSKYRCKEFPTLEIVLLNKKSDTFMYPKKGSICSALETYKTILCFV